MRYLPLTEEDRRSMLAAIGVPSVDDLFVDVPGRGAARGPPSICPCMPANGRSSVGFPPWPVGI